MDIINPFEEIVVFGKRLPMEPQSSTRLRALKPTGKHLGHGLDLTHVRGRASGGRATKLERYTTSPKGLRQGPFSGSSLKNGSKLLEVKGTGKGYRTGPFGKADEPSRRSTNKERLQATGAVGVLGGSVAGGGYGGYKIAGRINRKRRNMREFDEMRSHVPGRKTGIDALSHLLKKGLAVPYPNTGPFGKGILTAAPSKGLVRGGIQSSLDSIAKIPKPTLKPTGASWKQPIAAAAALKNSKIPNGAKRGGRL